MTQEEKRLLLIDLCGRLPHRVKCYAYQYKVDGNHCECYGTFDGILNGYFYLSDRVSVNGGKTYDERYLEVKPYLRPVSSMSKEEMDKLFDILHIDKDGNDEDWIKINDVLGIKFFFPTGKWVENVIEAYDYLNSIHIDYRSLIPMGLALEAPKDMYKTE